MTRYFYLPRSDAELRGMVREWNQSRQNLKNSQDYVVVRHASIGKPLKRVTQADRLYVFGHGNMGQGIGPTGRGLTARQLAKRIKADGLSKAHPEIRLFACNTAVQMQKELQPYAERFAAEMARIGYQHIRVVGYIGFMSLPRQGGTKASYLELTKK